MRPGLTVVLCVLVLGCSARPDIANLDSRGSAIICFGDSLTQGVGASPGHDYPNLLAKTLSRDVSNAGAAGETTRDALRRLDKDVLSRNPQLVIVEFGGNDFLQHMPREDIFANLETMVRRIQEHGAMVVLVGIQAGLFGDATRQDYQKVARARRAAFVPNIMEGIFYEPALKSDELHPNDAGYEKIAKRLAKIVVPLLNSEHNR